MTAISNPVSYRFCVAEGELRKKAIALHFQRYLEVGFFRKDEQDPYEKKSVYFVALSESEEVVGVIRLITGELDELPTIKHFRIYDLDLARLEQLEKRSYGEVSAFTKLPQHDVGIGLLKAVYLYSLRNGITHWICCIDERVFRYMQRMFLSPFKVVGEPKVYLGSKTIPSVMALSDCASKVKDSRNRLFEYFHNNNDSWAGVANQ